MQALVTFYPKWGIYPTFDEKLLSEIKFIEKR